MQPEEAAGGHEGEREQQDACVATTVRRLTRRVAEDERDRTDEPEDDEVSLVVLEVRVESRALEQRDETDQRQCCGQHAHHDDCSRAGTLTNVCHDH